jgi:uncharacterized protein YaaN involved in tellurite resistance
MTTAQQEQTKALVVADAADIRKELALVDPSALGVDETIDPELDQQAENFVKQVLAYNPEDPAQLDDRGRTIAAVELLGAQTQKDAAHRSRMLKEPIRKLGARGEDGGEVANALIQLKNEVEALDPGRFDFKPGWFTRTLGRIPGIGSPLKNYFSKFESSQTVIEAIMRALEEGRHVLQRDNVTLAQDQKVMRELTHKLQQTVQLGMLVDQKLTYALDRDIPAEDPRRRFIEEEMLFPLRQRIQDLQQQLAVNQQGVLAIEIIVRNNKELIKGVNRGMNVTVNALNVAVTVALALANQKIVLDKIQAVNRVTDDLIASTSEKLKTQGVAIQKQASDTQLNIETLKKAFADINTALDDIASFRRKALPQMAQNILEMDELTQATEESIKRMEKGNQIQPTVMLDIVD